MNSNQNQDIAWLHLQDLQREAENRRLIARRPSPTMAALKRLAARTAGLTRRGASTESRQELA
jgi:hypothetical protein